MRSGAKTNVATSLILLMAAAAASNGQISIRGLGRLPGSSANHPASTLDEGTLGAGVKDVLSVGTERAVTAVARPGGFLENAEIKILLPEKLRPVENVARRAGGGAKIDSFVASMNHAAEQAAPEAAHIFADAVRGMTVDDARHLLTGGDTAITDFFRSKTSTELAAAFRPHVEAAMDANGVTQQYNALAGSSLGGFAGALGRLAQGSRGNSSAGGDPTPFDIHTYVVGKALDGLFFMLGQEEKQIRTNPAARTSAILRQVFGR